MNQLAKNWLTILVTFILSTVGSIIIMSMAWSREDKSDIDNKLSSKASIDYVDKQDSQLRTDLKTHEEQDSKREEITQKWMQSIDEKLNILINKR